VEEALMTTTRVYKDSDTTVYERKDNTPIIGTGHVDYKATDNHSNAEATGKSVSEAVDNLRSGSK
jgi:hypothetical protein